MADKKKLNDEQLDSVSGGMGNVDMSGSKVRGDIVAVDSHTDYDEIQVQGDYTTGSGNVKAGGDYTGGNKTDVDAKVDVKSNVKRSLF